MGEKAVIHLCWTDWNSSRSGIKVSFACSVAAGTCDVNPFFFGLPSSRRSNIADIACSLNNSTDKCSCLHASLRWLHTENSELHLNSLIPFTALFIDAHSTRFYLLDSTISIHVLRVLWCLPQRPENASWRLNVCCSKCINKQMAHRYWQCRMPQGKLKIINFFHSIYHRNFTRKFSWKLDEDFNVQYTSLSLWYFTIPYSTWLPRWTEVTHRFNPCSEATRS